METNFLDEIFAQINLLEAENKSLKEELEKLNQESDVNIEKFLTINKENKANEIDEFKKALNLFPHNYNMDKENASKNLYELEIIYKPYDNLDFLDITGDFTNWQKTRIEKVKII